MGECVRELYPGFTLDARGDKKYGEITEWVNEGSCVALNQAR